MLAADADGHVRRRRPDGDPLAGTAGGGDGALDGGEHVGDAARGGARGSAAGEAEHVVDQALEVAEAAGSPLEQVGPARPGEAGQAGVADVEQRGRQRGAHLVRQGRRELAEGGEPLVAVEHAVEPVLGGDVGEEQQFAAVPGDGPAVEADPGAAGQCQAPAGCRQAGVFGEGGPGRVVEGGYPATGIAPGDAGRQRGQHGGRAGARWRGTGRAGDGVGAGGDGHGRLGQWSVQTS